MKLEIVSPNGVIYDNQVVSVTLPGILGTFTVWEHHAPLITTLTKGKITYKPTTKQVFALGIDGGFAEISNNTVKVCIEHMI